MADLPGAHITITSMYTLKLERLDEIRTRGQPNFEKEFLQMVSQFFEELIIR